MLSRCIDFSLVTMLTLSSSITNFTYKMTFRVSGAHKCHITPLLEEFHYVLDSTSRLNYCLVAPAVPKKYISLSTTSILSGYLEFLYRGTWCIWLLVWVLSHLLQNKHDYTSCVVITWVWGTVQLTGNVAGTRTTRHASTRETREGTGSPRGIASKTTRELNYSQFTRETSLKGPGTVMIQPVHKIHVTEHSDMQLQHICTLYWTWLLCRSV